MDQRATLSQRIAGQPVHRRHIQKADGRDLLLYGYHPHNETPQTEDASEVAKGGELRWHPLRSEWNLYAPHRQNRTFKPAAAADPLAPSVAGQSATEIPFTDFELAIFENKFTSLHAEAPEPPSMTGLKIARADGRCDVVVYTPEAQGNLHTIGQAARRLLLAAWVDRYETLREAGYKFILPFENRGDEVGVTLPHPHGQIYAFPFVPNVQAKAAKAFAAGYSLEDGIARWFDDYGVARAGGISAFCPPFARFPFEVWIAPDQRCAGPWEFAEDQTDGFAHLLGDMTRRYDVYFQRPTAYMLSLHAAPAGTDDSFHFTAQFYPLLRAPNRVKYLASVEQSTGTFTVDVMPEFAARTLRALT
ncbi:galactose-1-phosphate uridylyltransferase [Litorimonas sp. RW-G-Af-16]|uniref:galactose-1-phosphate uridylyltransferase n=1 Tax=Litorimonas sp. RW-G-Af-16 TaxID=3241168 RepID=UPI00390C74AF